jgi:AraC family transcriptional regulator
MPLNGEDRSMSCKPILRDRSQENYPITSKAQPRDLPNANRPPAGVEMARVLKTAPLRMASDPSSGAIAYWKHEALHDVVEPMADHVIMSYPSGLQRLERRSGRSVAIGTARSGVVTIIPAGSSARWDIPGPVNVVQLYLPPTTLQRVAGEAGVAAPSDLLERTGHPDLTTSRLLLSAADVIEGSAALDALFRQQLTDLLATRLLAAHTGAPTTFQPTMGGLSPTALRRAIERLRSNSDADLSLAALASDAGLSRFHFCRAFKESTGLSPHAWLRQHRLEQAMNMLRDTDASVVSVAAALGYASQTAFAAAFRKLTGETPSDWRRRTR